MTSDTRQWAPLPLRAMLGMGFIHHGFHKIVFTGQHWEFVTLLQWIGVPAPDQVLWLVSIFEFAAGVAILLGAFSRVVPIPLIVHMLVTLIVVHARQGFDFMQFDGMSSAGPRFGVPGYEVNLLYVAGLVALLGVGPGRPSIDAWRLTRRLRSRTAAGSDRSASHLPVGSGDSRCGTPDVAYAEPAPRHGIRGDAMAQTRPWLAHYDADVPTTLAPYPDRTLLDYVAESARTYPDRPVMLFKGHPVTYAELERQSDAFAAALAARNVVPGDRIALCLPNCPQFIIAEMGAWKAGAIACPLNPTYTERELHDALSTSGAATAVVLNRYYDKLKGVQRQTPLVRLIATGIKEYLPFALRMGYTLLKEKEEGEHITLRDGDERFADLVAHHESTGRPTHRVAPDDPAVILMSGGTTGTPKGVVGSHRGMVAAGIQLRAWLKSAMNEWSDIIMLPLPLFHTYGNTGVQSLAFINHNPLCLIPDARDFGGLLKEIATVKPAFICAVPTLLSAILNHKLARQGKVDFHSIKLCFCGAAPLMAETQRRFEELTGGVIVEGYSLTEAQMAVLANPVRGEKKIGSVGMPLPDVDLRIVDADNGTTAMPLGDVGEIVLSAPQLMLGYWQRPEETKAMLRTGEDGQRLLYTGDLGYLDADGYVFIVDRKKDLIKTSGYQVWPREIEEVISAHPSVAEVGVVGVPDNMKGETVKAFVVFRPGMSATEPELKTFCRERLAPYKVPSAFEFVAELPKSQVGKVLRRALRQ